VIVQTVATILILMTLRAVIKQWTTGTVLIELKCVLIGLHNNNDNNNNNNNDKKALLSQGNRSMLQLLFSV